MPLLTRDQLRELGEGGTSVQTIIVVKYNTAKTITQEIRFDKFANSYHAEQVVKGLVSSGYQVTVEELFEVSDDYIRRYSKRKEKNTTENKQLSLEFVDLNTSVNYNEKMYMDNTTKGY